MTSLTSDKKAQCNQKTLESLAGWKCLHPEEQKCVFNIIFIRHNDFCNFYILPLSFFLSIAPVIVTAPQKRAMITNRSEVVKLKCLKCFNSEIKCRVNALHCWPVCVVI